MNKLKIALLLSYICIASISAAIITPALPQIKAAYALNYGALGWVISIFLFGYVIGQLVYAPIANRYGRLVALRSGLMLYLLGIFICAVSAYFLNFSLLLIGRLISALGAASGLTCTFMMINELLSKAQAKQAMSFAIVSFTVGIGLAVSIGGLLTQYLSWHASFVFLFAHGFIMFLLTWQFPETLSTPRPLQVSSILSGYKAALSNRSLIIYSLTVGLVSAVGYGYSAVAPIFSQSILNLTPEVYGYWNLLNMLGMLGSGFLSAYLMKQYGPKLLLMLGFGGMIPCLMALVLIATAKTATPITFFMATTFLYLFSGLLYPAASFFASNAVEDKASASSVMSFINMGSAMIAVIILGYLPVSSLLAFVIIISAFFILAFFLSFSSGGGQSLRS